MPVGGGGMVPNCPLSERVGGGGMDIGGPSPICGPPGGPPGGPLGGPDTAGVGAPDAVLKNMGGRADDGGCTMPPPCGGAPGGPPKPLPGGGGPP